MSQKLLPLPLAGTVPQGSDIPFWHQYRFRRRLNATLYLLGLVLGLSGAWLGVSRSPVSVALDQAGYHVAGKVLPLVTPGDYSGDVALVLRRGGGTIRAAASGHYGGQPMQGICILVIGAAREQCIFVIGQRSYTAEDVLDAGVWHRHYSDGLGVDIRLADPADPIPVPLPVGRT